jgi:hypothetical protein
MSGQKTYSFSILLPVFVNTERYLKVVSYQHVYEMISLLIRLLMPDNYRDYNLLTCPTAI